jgi:peptide/nickel transport system ATP-binding protein/oligopeptide transport system ATP-binding protein
MTAAAPGLAGPRPDAATDEPLLRVRGLDVIVTVSGAPVALLDGIDLDVRAGRTTGLIGESGSGKSMLASAIIGLLPPGMRATGSLRFGGEELVGAAERRRRQLRGAEIAMIFQDPLASLNPVQRIGRQVGEILRRRRGLRGGALRDAAVALLGRAGIPSPAARSRAFPHELSGGLRQRAMIAMALAGEPALLLSDEATTALDVTVQKRILALLGELQASTGMAMLFVSHDLRVVSHVADDLVVMYAGRIAESGPTREVLRRPAHPYTRALARSIPSVRSRSAIATPLGGVPANPVARPAGCAFHPRCPLAQEICRREVPAPREVAPGRLSACHFAEEVMRDGDAS